MPTTAQSGPVEPGERGALTVSGTVVERIAARAAREVDGVGGAAGRVLGIAVGAEDLDNSAKVTAKVAGGTASLDVRLSVSYPASVARTTDAAREHLVRRVHELTGLDVSRVDITVTALLSGATTTRRVR
ncbi:Asp23/Gls24 family envelope stress response protein [Actinokineospora bangkokensis]|uniref:Asp23/Gls24 family envelope stress response protein n=1 Tax=Actinokineospora bangkokensis TaxID=1193682 RepID=A0A1Q9LIG6_9PSEU|nr:Asp23/Gls24 family envelope stress response protein [Actinokineospora bangkokensis]OLR91837.1 hypothetical protein BJP25_23650 [Actinokineospora bangkokensis]